MEFLPKPKEVKLLTGEHALCYDGRIVLEGRLLGNGDTYAKVLQQGIQKETGMQYEMGYGVPGRKETGAIVLGLDETLKSQQYVLQVTEENITIQGGDGAGVLYGVQTLHCFRLCGSRMSRICRCAAIISMKREAVC